MTYVHYDVITIKIKMEGITTLLTSKVTTMNQKRWTSFLFISILYLHCIYIAREVQVVFGLLVLVVYHCPGRVGRVCPSA